MCVRAGIDSLRPQTLSKICIHTDVLFLLYSKYYALFMIFQSCCR